MGKKSTWSEGLDPKGAAYKIAADDSSRIRVLAGPGTGKSFAIKRRITRLLESGVVPNRVLAVTFTRMAAADLVRDIRSLGIAGAEKVHARTLHSECFRILGKNSVIEITGRYPRPLAGFEFEPMLADLREAAAGRNKKDMRGLISAYEAAWARLQHETPGHARTRQDETFEAALVAWLSFHSAMLIGELVPFTFKYLHQNPSAAESSKYSHVLVDEYQDLNRAEQEVAAQLAANGELIIVGDDDQSIYSFKNAHRVGIIEFPNSHAGTSNHTMDECQRCPRRVVSMANSLIKNNKARPSPPRALKPLEKNGDGVVEIYQFGVLDDELAHIKKRIRRFISDGVPPGQIIVLCQSREYVRNLYESLRTASVPCQFCYQESEFDEEGAKERMAILTLAGNLDDRVALRYALGLGSTTWRSSQWKSIRVACEEEGVTPWDVLCEMQKGQRSTSGLRQLIDRFTQVHNEVTLLRELTGSELLGAWLPAGACDELRALADPVVASDDNCDAATLAKQVREAVTEPEVPDEVPDVRIMSLHKSKGLSASVVIIAGCVEGILPRQKPEGMKPAAYGEVIEEFRRLFFVGLTRVKASPALGRPGHLIITASVQIPTAIAMKGVAIAGAGSPGMKRTIMSRFIDELGPDAPAPKASN